MHDLTTWDDGGDPWPVRPKHRVSRHQPSPCTRPGWGTTSDATCQYCQEMEDHKKIKESRQSYDPMMDQFLVPTCLLVQDTADISCSYWRGQSLACPECGQGWPMRGQACSSPTNQSPAPAAPADTWCLMSRATGQYTDWTLGPNVTQNILPV